MIISDNTIAVLLQNGQLIKTELTVEELRKNKQLQPNSFDLTLANTWSKIKPNAIIDGRPVIDVAMPIEYDNGTFDEYYIVEPNEFLLMASNDVLDIPNGMCALICGRSSIARIGITTEDAGFIDAGFNGTITLEIQNKTEHPIVLRRNMRIAQVYFIRAEHAQELYGKDKDSKYNGQIVATGSMIHKDFE